MKGFPFRHSRLVLGLWFVPAFLGGGLFLACFELNNSVGVWFPKEDPALATYEEFLGTFGAWEWTLLLLESADAESDPPGSEIRALSRRLEELPSIRQVLGPDAVAALGSGIPGNARVPGDLRGIPLLLETANQIHRGDDFRAELLEQIRKEVRLCDGIVSHTVVGTSVINVGLNRSAKRDMLLFFNLVFVLLVVVSWILLRSWRDTVVILVVATSAVTVTLGLAALLGHRFNILTIMMPTLLIALSVANLVHLVHAFHHHRRSGKNAGEAAVRAAQDVRLPALGATLTTVLGFLSLAVSDMPPVRQLSLYSAAGILLAWVGTMVVAPVLLTRVWGGRDDGPPPARIRLRVLDAWARRLPRMGPALLILMAASIPLLAGLSRLETDTNYVNFFRPGSRVRAAYEQAARAGIPQSSIEVVVRSSSAPVSTTGFDRFLDGIRSLPETRGILFPDGTRGLRGFRAEEGRALRVVLFVEFIGNGAVGDLADRIRRTGAELLPHSEIQVTGSPVLWERMDASIVRTQKNSTLIVALGAFVLLAVLFKSLRAAAAGWLSSALPVGIILGLMGWLGVPVTLATVLIAGITLGLAVDDTVHLVTAFRLRLAAGIQPPAAIREALLTVGERMIVTSLILAGSFSVMAFSDFTPTASFGVFTALTILIALVADLTILPWMLGRNGMWKTAPLLAARRLSTKPHTGVHGNSQKSGPGRPARPGAAAVIGWAPED